MKVGLFGYGVVGSGIYEFLLRDEMRHNITVESVLERRDIPEIKEIRSENVDEILADPTIDTVIEVLGGFEPAHTFAIAAVLAGKNLITANKLMLAQNYSEIMRAAREKGVSVAFSATVGGGIPFLKNLSLVSHADTVLEVGGIMNGTTNFILDEMQSKGADFAETLKKAQALGYAESNPSADIDAIDLRCKLALCCSVGFDAACHPDDIPTMGVRHIQKKDIDVFRAHGLRVRLIGKGVRLEDGSVCAFCEPTLVGPGQNEYSVYGVENYIYYIGERTGKHGFGGFGAGRKTTAVNVYLDAIDILHGYSPFDQVSCENNLNVDARGAKHRYYLRTSAQIPQAIEIEVRLGNGMYITKPMGVLEMHSHAKTMQEADETTFFAGWAD